MCVCVAYYWTAGVSNDDALSMGKRQTSNIKSVGSIEVLLGKQSSLNWTENNKIRIDLITTCTRQVFERFATLIVSI